MKTRWEPIDIIILIIVFIIGVVLIFGEVKEVLMDHDITALKDISHAIGGLVTIVSTYVGFRLGKKVKKDKEL